MELSEDQRFYLQTIFDYFRENGKWPTYKYIDRKLTRTRRDLDIAEISKKLPPGFATAFAANRDLNALAILNIFALSECRGTEEDLANFVKAIHYATEKHFNASEDETEIVVLSDELKVQLNLSELAIRKVGLILRDSSEYRIYENFGMREEDSWWSWGLSRDIRYFDGVTSLKEYLTKLYDLRKSSSPKTRVFLGAREDNDFTTDEVSNALKKLELIQQLISESKELEETAGKIQQNEEVGLSADELRILIEKYSTWYSKSLSLLSSDLQQRFRANYEGSFWNAKIKRFFEAATEKSLLRTQNKDSSVSNGLISYWAYPFQQNFYPYLLDQRQILVEEKNRLSILVGLEQTPTIDKLIAESKKLEEQAGKIQKNKDVGATVEEINALVENYLVWFSQCLSLLPNDLIDKFRAEYEGTWYSLKIKKFLEAPIQRNPVFTENNDENALQVFSYWLYPYDTTFRNPLLAQRQFLEETKERKKNHKKDQKENRSESRQSTANDSYLFEQLIKELLYALNFTDIEELSESYGFDFRATYPSKSLTDIIIPQIWLISVKYRNTQNSQAATSLTRYITSLLSNSQTNNVAKMLFIDYSNFTSFGKEYANALVKSFGGRLEFWDKELLNRVLSQFPELLKKYENIISLASPPLVVPPKTSQMEIAERLNNCKPGQENWREFENICIDVLREAFVPPLKRVEPQARTENGLERRDALLPLLGAKDGWEEISLKYDAHFLLCEFKNYVSPIGKDEVNQASNYLKGHIGRIGIIFSRMAPSPSALNMRRSVYAEWRKIILFFEDKHLLELLKMKETQQNPLQLIQDAILNFLLKYE